MIADNFGRKREKPETDSYMVGVDYRKCFVSCFQIKTITITIMLNSCACNKRYVKEF